MLFLLAVRFAHEYVHKVVYALTVPNRRYVAGQTGAKK